GGDQIWMLHPGSQGAEWHPAVGAPLPQELVVEKWHYDAYSDTDLDLTLRSLGVKTVVFVGFTTNVCVETSARHAAMKGYDVVVVSDCTAAYEVDEHAAALADIDQYFGFVRSRKELSRIWQT